MVQMLTEDGYHSDPGFVGRQHNWVSLMGLNRITEQVTKVTSHYAANN